MLVLCNSNLSLNLSFLSSGNSLHVTFIWNLCCQWIKYNMGFDFWKPCHWLFYKEKLRIFYSTNLILNGRENLNAIQWYCGNDLQWIFSNSKQNHLEAQAAKIIKILESLEIRASALMEFMLVMLPVVRKALCMDLALSMIKYLI